MALHSPSPLYQWTFGRVVWATLVLAAVGLSFWLLYRFHQVLFILFVAVVLGTILRPVVAWLHRWRIPPKAGVLLVYLLLLALFTGFVLLLFPLIVTQIETITTTLPGQYQTLREGLLNHPNQLLVDLSVVLPPTLSLPDSVPQTGPEMLTSAGLALGYIGTASQIIFTAVVILLLAYYWTLDGPRTTRSLLLLVPLAQRESIGELIAAMETKVSAFMAGQGLLMLAIGSMSLVAYWLIGLPHLLALAFIAGLLEVVPIIGPLLGAVPALLVALTLGPDKVILVVVATLIIQQLENSLLVPRIMRHAVGVNPFVTLLAILAFSSLLGIAGALMAIPMAAMIQILLERYVFRPGAMETEVSGGRDYASRLRQEAQELAQDLRQQTRQTPGGSEEQVKQTEQVMDEIETLATDLDRLLAEAVPAGAT
ncbi:MAG: AI-2E family transporter [Anaerolineae bacterium]|nr:AI-2E family transporter [Anaerolineae bacterium]